MAENKWISTGGYGRTEWRGIVGPLHLKVWWASGMVPEESALPPYKVSVFGYALKTRFATADEAKEAAEKLALKWARATIVELAEEETNAT